MSRVLGLFCLALGLGLCMSKPAAAQLKAIAPFLDEQTLAVVRLDLSRLELQPIVKKLGEFGIFTDADLAKLREEGGRVFKALTDAGVREAYLVASLAEFPNQPPFVVIPTGDEDANKAVMKLLAPVVRHVARIGSAVVVGEPAVVNRLRGLKPTEMDDVSKAFAGIGDSTLQAVVVLPKSLRKALEETLPKLPADLGGGSTKTITRGFLWASAGVDLTPKLAMRVTVQADSADEAMALSKLVAGFFTALAKKPNVKRDIPDLDKILHLIKPKVTGDRLTLNLDDKELSNALVPLLVKAEKDAQRVHGINQLKQIGLALHNYHDRHQSFPAHASYNKQGKPLLSWRVQILPYLEQNALYQEFRHNEPWDSEHNKKLIPRMPEVFRLPSSRAAAGKTVYLAPAGMETIFPPINKSIRIQDITDGTSNTIMVVEADDAHAVEWTKPEDLKVDAKQPFAGIGGKENGRFLALFADGSVRTLDRRMAPTTLWAYFTRSGGEVIPPE